MSDSRVLPPCAALARTLGWITSVATMVVMAFIANRWPQKASTVAGGMIGVAVALLNDSWQMMAIANHTMGFAPLPPARAILHDLVALAICLGGMVLVVFTGNTDRLNDPDYDVQYAIDGGMVGAAFTRKRLMAAAQWFLMGVM